MKKAMSILISGIMSVAAIPFAAVNAEDNTELWEDFLKYDLCITDYDSLTEKEQELCHFIFDTETNSEDTVVCERARNILAGYDVGERITPELAAKYKNIVSSKYLYYNRSDEEYYEYDFPSLIALPDISHVDETNLCNEYWLDDNKSAAVISDQNGLFLYEYDSSGNILNSQKIDVTVDEPAKIEEKGLTFTIMPDNSASVIGYNGTDIDITIPEKVEGHTVKTIDVGAFRNASIASVVLPDTIESIYPNSFVDCIGLTTINFPKKLKYIGNNAFGNCTSLKDVTIDCPYVRTFGNVFASAKADNVTVNIKEPSSWLYGGFSEVKNFSLGEKTEILTLDYLTEFPELGIPSSTTVIKALHNMNFDEIDELSIPKNIKILCAYPEPRGVIVANWGEQPAFIPLRDGFSIKGYKGTEAESYAQKWKLNFIAVDEDNKMIIGDANCDGELSMADAVTIMQYISNPDKYGENGTDKNHITEQGKKNADIAGENDGVTNADALAIQKKLLKLD